MFLSQQCWCLRRIRHRESAKYYIYKNIIMTSSTWIKLNYLPERCQHSSVPNISNCRWSHPSLVERRNRTYSTVPGHNDPLWWPNNRLLLGHLAVLCQWFFLIVPGRRKARYRCSSHHSGWHCELLRSLYSHRSSCSNLKKSTNEEFWIMFFFRIINIRFYP